MSIFTHQFDSYFIFYSIRYMNLSEYFPQKIKLIDSRKVDNQRRIGSDDQRSPSSSSVLRSSSKYLHHSVQGLNDSLTNAEIVFGLALLNQPPVLCQLFFLKERYCEFLLYFLRRHLCNQQYFLGYNHIHCWFFPCMTIVPFCLLDNKLLTFYVEAF